MTIEERQHEIIAEFSMFDDWMQKYEHIIELARELPVIDVSKKTDDNLIRGCQSKVWLDASLTEDGMMSYTADSDAIITKGLVSLVIRVVNGMRPSEILEADLHFVKDIGLLEHLSPTRSNGLAAMLKQIKMYALAFSAKAT
jgi:cysteine desulfuration protein SufE